MGSVCVESPAGGDNMALVSTMVNTFGGQWFDMAWKPQIDTAPWTHAISFYWLWAWSLAIPSVSAKTPEAQRFVRWATSKEYVQLVGTRMGWNQVPTGTRISTYRNPNFIKGSRWAYSEASAIALSNPTDATLPPSSPQTRRCARRVITNDGSGCGHPHAPSRDFQTILPAANTISSRQGKTLSIVCNSVQAFDRSVLAFKGLRSYYSVLSM